MTGEFSSDKPDTIKSYLRNLDEQFKSYHFTASEWSSINEKLYLEIIPILQDLVKSKDHEDLAKVSLEFLVHHAITKRTSLFQWKECFSLAVKTFNLSISNKLSVYSIELVQKCFSNASSDLFQDETFDRDKVTNFIQNGLIRTLTQTSPRPSPTLVQAINACLGLICK